MKALFRLVSGIAFASLCACGGGGSSGPGSVTGPIKGDQFKIVDAISWTAMFTDTSTGTTSTQAQIFLSTTKDLCGDFGSSVQTKGVKLISLGMADVNGTAISAPTAAGAYTIVPPNPTSLPPKAALMSAIVTDQTCMDVPASDAKATGGTVTLKSVKSDVYTGSFDITLDSGDHITGSFSPEACPAIQTALDATTPPTCM